MNNPEYVSQDGDADFTPELASLADALGGSNDPDGASANEPTDAEVAAFIQSLLGGVGGSDVPGLQDSPEDGDNLSQIDALLGPVNEWGEAQYTDAIEDDTEVTVTLRRSDAAYALRFLMGAVWKQSNSADGLTVAQVAARVFDAVFAPANSQS